VSDFDAIRQYLKAGIGVSIFQTNALAALARIEAAAEQTEKALYGIVMAEPLEVDGRTMWPSFSGELQHKAYAALSLLRGEDTEEGAA